MDVKNLPSPALIINAAQVDQNLKYMVNLAGNMERLRPHCKTHKIREIIELQLQLGILKHKCATLAEAIMLADSGVKDIMLAYPLVGPNIARAQEFMAKYPDIQFACTLDNSANLMQLASAFTNVQRPLRVFLDLDVGMHRTGILPGDAALKLYRQISQTSGLQIAGLHVYDGQNHQSAISERQEAAQQVWSMVTNFRAQLLAADLLVSKIVIGGTPTFPMYAALNDTSLEFSPGTVILHDAGYQTEFPDLPFAPALQILTRVVSVASRYRFTLDLGHKAVAADAPTAHRLVIPEIPTAKVVMHSEEHVVMETSEPVQLTPGDSLFAIPWHVCPTCALHKEIYVVRDNQVIATWQVSARNRV